jgi:hypothetical protein
MPGSKGRNVDGRGDLVAAGLEGDLMVFAADLDPPHLLVHGAYIPAGLLAVGRAHVDLAIDDQGPHQGRGAIGDAVLANGEMYRSRLSAIARRSSSFQELMVVLLFCSVWIRGHGEDAEPPSGVEVRTRSARSTQRSSSARRKRGAVSA